MNEKIYCHKHGISPDDERWKVVLEELTNSDDEEHREPFKGQICPVCYLNLKSMVREMKRNLKIESRENVSLRSENDKLQEILDAVIVTVKNFTGKDAVELAAKAYERPMIPGLPPEQGKMSNILPNLISEAITTGGKKP
jgi:hypothetical protein